MTYTVFVDDNSHYMDEEYRYKLGEFETLEAATKAAEELLEKWVKENRSINKTGSQTFSDYCAFGDDPFIIGPDQKKVLFSARDYMKDRTAILWTDDECY